MLQTVLLFFFEFSFLIASKEAKNNYSQSIDCFVSNIICGDVNNLNYNSPYFSFDLILPFPKVISKTIVPNSTFFLTSDYKYTIDYAPIVDIENIIHRYCYSSQITYYNENIKNLTINKISIQKIANNINNIKNKINNLIASDDVNYEKYKNHNIYINHKEFYLLEINTNGDVYININTRYGLINAFATLKQLIYSPFPIYLPLCIADWPDNNWRGSITQLNKLLMLTFIIIILSFPSLNQNDI
jgi:hypothetical protein